MAVKELITLRRDRPLVKSFTTSAFNGSVSPAGAAPQLVKAFAAAARVSGSQCGDTVRGAAAPLPQAGLLGAGGTEGTGRRGNCSQEADFEILVLFFFFFFKKSSLFKPALLARSSAPLAAGADCLNGPAAVLWDVCFII